MDIVKFLSDQWGLIASAPVAFGTYAVLMFGVGFAAGKLFYGTVAEVAKARLEAARDGTGSGGKDRVTVLRRI